MPPHTSPKWDCLAVGLALADHLCHPIDHLPKAGELVISDRLELAVGGCAANVAVDLARQQVNVGIVARLGQDIFGEFVQRTMHSAGVDTSPLKITPESETSGTLVVNVRGQDRRFIHTFGAAALFDGSELTPEQILDTRVLYVGGYFAMPRLTPDALVEWFRIARSGNVATVLDVVIPGPGDYPAALKTILPHTDYFLPNSDEAEIMTGLSDPLDQARLFRDWGASTVIITCGESGAVALSPADNCRSSVFPVDYIDGTGSGDAFDAGIICGILEQADLRRSISLGAALGASAVRKPGATAGVFTRQERDAFLRQHALEFQPL
jgi:sugar/nucleoside kinase (ribokinase family)